MRIFVEHSDKVKKIYLDNMMTFSTSSAPMMTWDTDAWLTPDTDNSILAVSSFAPDTPIQCEFCNFVYDVHEHGGCPACGAPPKKGTR